jgi:hypothetical protein
MAEDYAIRVYKYGIVGDVPESVVEEIRRGHVLRNQLVEIERDYERAVDDVWAQQPDLVSRLADVERLGEELEAARDEAKKERQRAKKREVAAETRSGVKQVAAELKVARKALREVKSVAYNQGKHIFVEVRQERQQKIKDLYRISVNDGLFWATYNDIKQKHLVAVAGVKSKRTQGQKAELRFRRWMGEGTIAVQLQREMGAPRPTPDLIADPSRSPWRNFFVMPSFDPFVFGRMRRAERRKIDRPPTRGDTNVVFRVGSGEASERVEVGAVIHRPIPLEAEIKLVRITRRVLAGVPRCYLTVTVRLPMAPARTQGTKVAVHLGWRSLGASEGIRVAVIGGAPSVPEGLRDVVWDRGGWAEVIVPARWIEGLARTSAIRGTRDTNMEGMKLELAAWLRANPQPELTPNVIMNWRAPNRFAALTHRWRETPPEGSDVAKLVASLEAWRRQDKHLWSWEANERDQIVARRNDMWRRIAAWLCTDAAVVAIDAWAMGAGGVSLERPAPEDTDTWQERLARAQRVIAAPAGLRDAISNAAAVRGVREQLVKDKVSQFHHGCGGLLDREERSRQIMVRCERCGDMVDQDVSALRYILDGGLNV